MTREFLWRRDNFGFLATENNFVGLSESVIGEGTTIERVIVTGYAVANSVSDTLVDPGNYVTAVEVTYGTDVDPPPGPERIAPLGTDFDGRDFLWMKAQIFRRTNDGNVAQVVRPWSGNFDVDTGTRRRVALGETAQVWFQWDQQPTTAGTGWRFELTTAVLLSFETT